MQLSSFATTLNEILKRRELLMKQLETAEGPGQASALSKQIENINSEQLPDLRKQVHNARNAASGAEKQKHKEIIQAIGSALNGMGTVEEIDVSEPRLRSLQYEKLQAKTGHEAKRIESEILRIRWARRRFKLQRKSVAGEGARRKKVEEEIRSLDKRLYGHLPSAH